MSNDQLININGFSLLGKSNEEAMQILREAIQVETMAGHIQLTISRKKKIMSSSDINQVHMMKEIATFDDQINNDKKADEINSNKNYLNENNKSEFISYNLSGLEK